MSAKLLFLLRHRDSPWGQYGSNLSSGLRNSVSFVVQMLNQMGISAEYRELVDDNCIDKAVTEYRPTHVILEAFWVRPSKIDQLKPRHPLVTWIVRDHSQTPFVALEGIAMGWTLGYLQRGVEISCNAPRAFTDMEVIGKALGFPGLISYSPNWYPVNLPKDHRHLVPHPGRADNVLRVGCFGAIRPLKNHLTQAVAALQFADMLGKKLEFYINAARIEQGASPILKNLQDLFSALPRAKLIQVGWLDHPPFLELLWSMDICLQVSFSETFNIVAADAARCSVALVGSAEIPWLGNYALADPNDSRSIVKKMIEAWKHNTRDRLQWQWRDLNRYVENTQRIWGERFGGHFHH